MVQLRNATVAVVGAGDSIGTAITSAFAAEGFLIFAGRRNGERRAPLVADLEACGGQIVARALDAHKEEQITAFLSEADSRAPLQGLGVSSRSPVFAMPLRKYATGSVRGSG